jgi:hypothetical protein
MFEVFGGADDEFEVVRVLEVGGGGGEGGAHDV